MARRVVPQIDYLTVAAEAGNIALSNGLRVVAEHAFAEAGFTRRTARTGAVTLIQRFGGALNLNVHLHMLFLDDVYVEGRDGSLRRFQWVKAPTGGELSGLTHTIARRVGRFLQRQGLVECDTGNSCLGADAVDDESMAHLQGHSAMSIV